MAYSKKIYFCTDQWSWGLKVFVIKNFSHRWIFHIAKFVVTIVKNVHGQMSREGSPRGISRFPRGQSVKSVLSVFLAILSVSLRETLWPNNANTIVIRTKVYVFIKQVIHPNINVNLIDASICVKKLSYQLKACVNNNIFKTNSDIVVHNILGLPSRMNINMLYQIVRFWRHLHS